MRDMTLPTVGGIRNRTGAHDTGQTRTRMEVVASENVDFGDDGEAIRRASTSGVVIARPGAHSLFYSRTLQRMFYVHNASLYSAATDNTADEQLVASLATTNTMRYTDADAEGMYCTNGVDFLHVTASAVTRGVGELALRPTVAVVPATGTLPAGVYHIALALHNLNTDVEGPPVTGIRVELLEQGAIVLGLGMESLWMAVNVYITDPNGEVYRFSHKGVSGNNTIISRPARGEILSTEGTSLMQAGEMIVHVGGRVYISRGNTLRYSEPFRPFLTKLAFNWVQVGGAITFLCRSGSTVFFGTSDGVYAMSTVDKQAFSVRRVTTDVAYPNSGTTTSAFNGYLASKDGVAGAEPLAVWMSESGVYVGLPDGDVKQIHEKTALVDGNIVHSVAEVLQHGVVQQMLFLTTRSNT